MKRRTLLKSPLALTGWSALSYARIAGANDRMGVALVGAGNRGRPVMGKFLETGRVDLRAVCDVYDQRRAQAVDELAKNTGQSPLLTAELPAVLARADVDAVLIATPDHLHIDQALAAAAAKKHIYLEKPSTHRHPEALRVLAGVRAAKVVCQTGTQQRSGAHYQRAREELFQTGKLGEIVMVRASWADFGRQRRWLADAPKPPGLDWARFLGRAPKVAYSPARFETWRYFPEYGGGLLADILTHWADVAQWMMNDARPHRAIASGGIYNLPDGRKNPDTVNALVQYEHWNLSFASSVLPLDMPAEVRFHGTLGTLAIDRGGYTHTPRGRDAKPVRVEATGDLDLAHVTDFLDAVRDGRTPSADIAIGVEALRPVHLAVASYWQRRPMRFAPTGGRIVDAA